MEKKTRREKEQKVKEVTKKCPSKTDPTGSYTGYPKNPNEVPVQDADDL